MQVFDFKGQAHVTSRIQAEQVGYNGIKTFTTMRRSCYALPLRHGLALDVELDVHRRVRRPAQREARVRLLLVRRGPEHLRAARHAASC